MRWVEEREGSCPTRVNRDCLENVDSLGAKNNQTDKDREFMDAMKNESEEYVRLQ